jgi:hypothetical protein
MAILDIGPVRIASFSPWVMPTLEGLWFDGYLGYRSCKDS